MSVPVAEVSHSTTRLVIEALDLCDLIGVIGREASSAVNGVRPGTYDRSDNS
jgi:hypothetical protein